MRIRGGAWVAGLGLVLLGSTLMLAFGTDQVGLGRTSPALPHLSQPGGMMIVQRPGACEQVDSLDALQSKAPFQILVPNTPLANPSNISSTAWCETSGVANETFDSGVVLVLSVSDLKDPTALWERFATVDDPLTDTVGTINGLSADLVDPSKDSTHHTPGGVLFVQGGLLVQVGGNGVISLAAMTDMASSLAPWESIGKTAQERPTPARSTPARTVPTGTFAFGRLPTLDFASPPVPWDRATACPKEGPVNVATGKEVSSSAAALFEAANGSPSDPKTVWRLMETALREGWGSFRVFSSSFRSVHVNRAFSAWILDSPVRVSDLGYQLFQAIARHCGLNVARASWRLVGGFPPFTGDLTPNMVWVSESAGPRLWLLYE